ncbi:hypothetical protein C7446_0318 [Kushneria sinocarnis]|uniref:DUF7282 domain-containing protein n=1 Tax=Kushneria sinocarnis TaxID=595502 RepID=A0A420X0X3_9GAMM|nr:hypothetical protein [Kushneria sinocarnis]RKR07506.1 hypothetical protein C7446_0318 [Kushneria sinocarnis]
MISLSLNRILPGLFTAGVMALSGAAGAATGNDVSPSLSVKDQSESFGRVTLHNVDMPANGFVVIHETRQGDGHGPVVGSAFAQAGHHAKVSVALDDSVQQQEQLTAMLHLDTAERYEFEHGSDHPHLDPPVEREGHQVTRKFTVTDIVGDESG